MEYDIKPEKNLEEVQLYSISSNNLKGKHLTMSQIYKIMQVLEGKEVMIYNE